MVAASNSARPSVQTGDGSAPFPYAALQQSALNRQWAVFPLATMPANLAACCGNCNTRSPPAPTFPSPQQLQAQAQAFSQALQSKQVPPQVQVMMQMRAMGIPIQGVSGVSAPSWPGPGPAATLAPASAPHKASQLLPPISTQNKSSQNPPNWSVPGNVWRLSRDPHGCRLVQGALEDAGSDDTRATLASELQGHIREATRCRHANHVVQKCIMTMRPQAMQFIIDEIMEKGPGALNQAARHEFGCRIVQRLLEHCQPEQVKGLVEQLLIDAVALSKHMYGNYVMQHVLEHGTPDHQHRLTLILEKNAREVAWDGRAQAVLGKALCHGSPEAQLILARALVRNSALVAMARTRYGSTAVKLVLEIVDGDDFTEAKRQLSEEMSSLRATRYGRVVVACLDPCSRAPSIA